MSDRLIGDQADFEQLCKHIRESALVAFDTEFVSEYTYRPELCLLQFSTPERCVAVDPYELDHLDTWWEIMADHETTVIVHGGQAEIQFCLSYSSRRPQQLVDVQLAEGLRSTSYPMGYTALVNRVLGCHVHGKETRTDWRRRPLSNRQIEYALEDVKHLMAIWNEQRASLEKLQRLAWAEAEFQRMIAEIDSDTAREGWRRISGIHRLSRRELAVAIELWQWREQEGQRKNRPARKMLRDDLIIDLAHRRPKNTQELLSTRDMNRPAYKQAATDLLGGIERASSLPESDLPKRSAMPKREKNQDEQVLGQLLAIALSNRCAEMNVARQLMGTSSDLRQLVRRHVHGETSGEPPRLMTGWRAGLCGDLLTDLLDGKISLRVADPESDHPLVFETRSSE